MADFAQPNQCRASCILVVNVVVRAARVGRAPDSAIRINAKNDFGASRCQGGAFSEQGPQRPFRTLVERDVDSEEDKIKSSLATVVALRLETSLEKTSGVTHCVNGARIGKVNANGNRNTSRLVTTIAREEEKVALFDENVKLITRTLSANQKGDIDVFKPENAEKLETASRVTSRLRVAVEDTKSRAARKVSPTFWNR